MKVKRLYHDVIYYDGNTCLIRPYKEALKDVNMEKHTSEFTLENGMHVCYGADKDKPICAFVNKDKLKNGIIDIIDVAYNSIVFFHEISDVTPEDVLNIFFNPKKTIVDGFEVIVIPVAVELHAEILNFAFDDYEENVIRRV